GRRANASRTRVRPPPTERAADAEAVGVDQRAVELELLALHTDVGDPVLSARVRAPRDVQLHVLMEARQAPLEILDEPPGKLLGLRERELAELRAGARDGPAAEWRAARGQPGLRKLTGERTNPLAAHVDDDDVLHRRRPGLSVAVALGRIGHRA